MDVANNYAFSIQQPEWATGCDDLKDMAMTSRKRILDMGFRVPFASVGVREILGAGDR
jgi:hypothetical protein